MNQPTDLHPDSTIQKFLISTTSYFTGEYHGADLLIAHSWANFGAYRTRVQMEETPLSRSGFIIAFRTEPVEEAAGVPIPDYGQIGEVICSLLAVLYGKRFDFHGAIEHTGLFQTPDLSTHEQVCDPTLPFNSHKPRTTSPALLELRHFERTDHMIRGAGSRPLITKLLAACRYYMLALQTAENEPEIAYLNLITVGEILSTIAQYSAEELLSDELVADLNEIRTRIGDSIANRIASKIKGIKTSFVKFLCSKLDDDFFENPEVSKTPHGRCFARCTIERNVKAAYDLRSSYLHAGERFGRWVEPGFWRHDVSDVGRPLGPSKELSKTLQVAPNFVGLERLIRYCLLQEIALVRPKTNAG
jgi:hypothetical protein